MPGDRDLGHAVHTPTHLFRSNTNSLHFSLHKDLFNSQESLNVSTFCLELALLFLLIRIQDSGFGFEMVEVERGKTPLRGLLKRHYIFAFGAFGDPADLFKGHVSDIHLSYFSDPSA